MLTTAPLSSLAIIKRLLTRFADNLPDNLRREMKPPTWLEAISRCKSRRMSPEDYRADNANHPDPDKVEWIARMFECVRPSARVVLSSWVLRCWRKLTRSYTPVRQRRAYESELENANALDFDDLLLRG